MKRIVLGALTVLLSFSSYAFSGSGAGTEKSPYLITSADELFEVRNHRYAYYRLENDIDLSAWLEENSPIYGWAPIGTDSSPFSGTFDGNGKKIMNLTIKREQTDNVGLFGYVDNAKIINTEVINPLIIGRRNVGTIIGYSYGSNLQIIKCQTIAGTVVGEQNVGGIVGSFIYVYSDNFVMNIDRCHNAAHVEGNKFVGGVCGFIYGHPDVSCNVLDCYSIGSVTGKQSTGGIIGGCGGDKTSSWSWIYYPRINCYRNYVRGNVIGESGVCGILGGNEYQEVDINVASNVCAADTIKGTYRIATKTTGDNYANVNTVLLSTNASDVEDNPYNGTSMSTRLLQKASTYQGLGWDFANTWVDMSEYNEYPVHKDVSPAPTVKTFEAKSKGNITGTTAFNNGTVYCVIDKTLYTSEIEDGKWEISLGNIRKGEKAIVAACELGKLTSSTVYSFAEKANVDPTVVMGDSNSDGVVDAADVVGTINYILGKPSSSFNQKNADVNEDGQILVDDAVGTVNVIMDNQ